MQTTVFAALTTPLQPTSDEPWLARLAAEASRSVPQQQLVLDLAPPAVCCPSGLRSRRASPSKHKALQEAELEQVVVPAACHKAFPPPVSQLQLQCEGDPEAPAGSAAAVERDPLEPEGRRAELEKQETLHRPSLLPVADPQECWQWWNSWHEQPFPGHREFLPGSTC